MIKLIDEIIIRYEKEDKYGVGSIDHNIHIYINIFLKHLRLIKRELKKYDLDQYKLELK